MRFNNFLLPTSQVTVKDSCKIEMLLNQHILETRIQLEKRSNQGLTFLFYTQLI